MKIKKFDNIWTMGLILSVSILALFYIIKIFFPEFIVGIAEIPQIVEFGSFIDSNVWAKHIYAFITAYIGGYIYCCACCRTTKLSLKGNLIFVGFIILLRLVSIFMPTQYSSINYVVFVITPFLICHIDNKATKETFISTVSCFTIDIMSQVFSATIRNLLLIASSVNSASFTILLIDTWIWRLLLYFYYNNKKGV